MCTLNSLPSLMNFSLYLNSFENFPWWCAMDMILFFFVRIISSYSFMTSAASWGFSTLSAFSCNSFVSIISLLTMESINCFFISSLLSRLVFLVFSEPPHNYKQKINTITINLRNRLQAKNAMRKLIFRLNAIPLHQNASFSSWLRVVKVLHHQHFWKTVFKINLISKKILKAFAKLNANKMQINI